MKKQTILELIAIVLLLFALIFAGIYYYSKEKKIEGIQKDRKIERLEFKLDSIHKSFNRYGVIITEDTLKVISLFTTRKGKEKIISTMPLYIGDNIEYFTLDENTGLHIKLIKYRLWKNTKY